MMKVELVISGALVTRDHVRCVLEGRKDWQGHTQYRRKETSVDSRF
jgi:hypothetical protein